MAVFRALALARASTTFGVSSNGLRGEGGGSPSFLPLAITLASAAPTLRTGEIQIIGSVRMALRTELFRQSSVPCVFETRGELQMLRTDAGSMRTGWSSWAAFIGIVAAMVPIEAFWRLSNQEVVCGGAPSFDLELPISVAVKTRDPHHATVSTARVDLRPEASIERGIALAIFTRHREPTLSGVMERAVSAAPLRFILAA